MYVEEFQRVHLSYPQDISLLGDFQEDEDWKMISEGTTGSTWEKKIVPLTFLETCAPLKENPNG